MGLIDAVKEKTGKTLNHSVTPLGLGLTDEYADLKRRTLLDAYPDLPNIDAKLDGYTRILSVLIGLYKVSARNGDLFVTDCERVGATSSLVLVETSSRQHRHTAVRPHRRCCSPRR